METTAQQATFPLMGWTGIHARVRNTSISDVKRRERPCVTVFAVVGCLLMDKLSNLLSCGRQAQAPILETLKVLRHDREPDWKDR